MLAALALELRCQKCGEPVFKFHGRPIDFDDADQERDLYRAISVAAASYRRIDCPCGGLVVYLDDPRVTRHAG